MLDLRPLKPSGLGLAVLSIGGTELPRSHMVLSSADGRLVLEAPKRPSGMPPTASVECPVCKSTIPAGAPECPVCKSPRPVRRPGEPEVLDYIEALGQRVGLPESPLEAPPPAAPEAPPVPEGKGREGPPARPEPERRGLTNGLARRRMPPAAPTPPPGRVNGLTSTIVAARRGMTNGLTNGNGFTNGLGSARFASEGRRGAWRVYLVPIVAVALLAMPLLLAPESALVSTYGIDGSFADWPARVSLAEDASLPGGIDLTSAAVRVEGDRFFGFVGTRDPILPGSPDHLQADVLRAFVDTDGNAATGYRAEGVGAEVLVEIAGAQGRVTSASVLEFTGADGSDWSGWQAVDSPVVAIGAGADATRLEFSFLSPAGRNGGSPRVLFESSATGGAADTSGFALSPDRGMLVVSQVSIAPDAFTGGSANLLEIRLRATQGTATLASLRLTAAGTLPEASLRTATLVDAASSSTLATADRYQNGFNLVLASPLTIAASETALRVEVGVDPAATGTLSVSIEKDSDVIVQDAAVYLETLPSDRDRAYAGAVPAGTVIDGAFGEWSQAADDTLNEPTAGGNPDVDLAKYDSIREGSTVAVYAKVAGRILHGALVPARNPGVPQVAPLDSDRDGVPDTVEAPLGSTLPFDFNNDNTSDAASGNDRDGDTFQDYPPPGTDYWLNTTIPAWYPAPYAGRFVSVYIGPVIPQTLEGVDSAIAYVDADNSSATGLVVMVGPAAYGFDWALAVVGRHGAVASSGLYRYQAGPAVPWTFVAALPAAVGGGRLEVSVPAALLNLSADYRTVYYASDWRLSSDLALPVPPGRSPAPGPGTRTPAGDNVVINEVSPLPNPEWVELANPTSGSISLAGWTLQRQKGFKWETVYTFVGGTIGAWGSGTEYFVANLPTNSLPNGQATIRLVDAAGRVVDITTYQPTGSGKTWSRFKDPTTGKPMDTDNDANDFYTSLFPSKGGPNDRHRPTIAVAKTGNRATAAPGDLITYTVYYNNTDTGRANHVWVNDTLPSQVTFVSSSATPAGNSGQTYYWHFTNVGPTTNNQFTVTVRVNDNVPNGASLVNRAVLEYTDQLNRKMTGSTAWWNVTCSRPVITVAKIGDKNTALPGDTIVYTIFYNNTGSANAAHVWLNDTLPNDVTFLSSSVPWTSRSGQTYRWHFTNVAPGAHSFTISVRVNLNATSSTLVNWVFLNYTTQNGYPLQSSSASWTVSIPEFSDLAIVAIVPLFVLGVRRLRRRNAGKKGTVADSVPGIGGR